MGICSNKESEKRQSIKNQNSSSINANYSHNPGSMNSKKSVQNIQEEIVNPKYSDMTAWEGKTN